jgi:hypothetical protein
MKEFEEYVQIEANYTYKWIGWMKFCDIKNMMY